VNDGDSRGLLLVLLSALWPLPESSGFLRDRYEKTKKKKTNALRKGDYINSGNPLPIVREDAAKVTVNGFCTG